MVRLLPRYTSALAAAEVECLLEKAEPTDAKASDEVESQLTHGGGAKVMDRSEVESTRISVSPKHSFVPDENGVKKTMSDSAFRIQTSRTPSPSTNSVGREAKEDSQRTTSIYSDSRAEEDSLRMQSIYSNSRAEEDSLQTDPLVVSASQESSLNSFVLETWDSDVLEIDGCVQGNNGCAFLDHAVLPAIDSEESYSVYSDLSTVNRERCPVPFPVDDAPTFSTLKSTESDPTVSQPLIDSLHKNLAMRELELPHGVRELNQASTLDVIEAMGMECEHASKVRTEDEELKVDKADEKAEIKTSESNLHHKLQSSTSKFREKTTRKSWTPSISRRRPRLPQKVDGQGHRKSKSVLNKSHKSSAAQQGAIKTVQMKASKDMKVTNPEVSGTLIESTMTSPMRAGVEQKLEQEQGYLPIDRLGESSALILSTECVDVPDETLRAVESQQENKKRNVLDSGTLKKCTAEEPSESSVLKADDMSECGIECDDMPIKTKRALELRQGDEELSILDDHASQTLNGEEPTSCAQQADGSPECGVECDDLPDYSVGSRQENEEFTILADTTRKTLDTEKPTECLVKQADEIPECGVECDDVPADTRGAFKSRKGSGLSASSSGRQQTLIFHPLPPKADGSPSISKRKATGSTTSPFVSPISRGLLWKLRKSKKKRAATAAASDGSSFSSHSFTPTQSREQNISLALDADSDGACDAVEVGANGSFHVVSNDLTPNDSVTTSQSAKASTEERDEPDPSAEPPSIRKTLSGVFTRSNKRSQARSDRTECPPEAIEVGANGSPQIRPNDLANDISKPNVARMMTDEKDNHREIDGITKSSSKIKPQANSVRKTLSCAFARSSKRTQESSDQNECQCNEAIEVEINDSFQLHPNGVAVSDGDDKRQNPEIMTEEGDAPEPSVKSRATSIRKTLSGVLSCSNERTTAGPDLTECPCYEAIEVGVDGSLQIHSNNFIPSNVDKVNLYSEAPGVTMTGKDDTPSICKETTHMDPGNNTDDLKSQSMKAEPTVLGKSSDEELKPSTLHTDESESEDVSIDSATTKPPFEARKPLEPSFSSEAIEAKAQSESSAVVFEEEPAVSVDNVESNDHTSSLISETRGILRTLSSSALNFFCPQGVVVEDKDETRPSQCQPGIECVPNKSDSKGTAESLENQEHATNADETRPINGSSFSERVSVEASNEMNTDTELCSEAGKNGSVSSSNTFELRKVDLDMERASTLPNVPNGDVVKSDSCDNVPRSYSFGKGLSRTASLGDSIFARISSKARKPEPSPLPNDDESAAPNPSQSSSFTVPDARDDGNALRSCTNSFDAGIRRVTSCSDGDSPLDQELAETSETASGPLQRPHKTDGGGGNEPSSLGGLHSKSDGQTEVDPTSSTDNADTNDNGCSDPTESSDGSTGTPEFTTKSTFEKLPFADRGTPVDKELTTPPTHPSTEVFTSILDSKGPMETTPVFHPPTFKRVGC